MEPLKDEELDELLREWRAPRAPGYLHDQVRRRVHGAWWRWLVTGSVRVPVPVVLAMAVMLVGLVAFATMREQQLVKNADGFQPVKRLEVRIIRSSYESKH